MQRFASALWSRLLVRVNHTDPVRLVLFGYLSYILLGWAALCLPWSQAAGITATALDHLFMATSAVSTTGLTTLSTADTYSFLGELFLLLLIQIGGLGYMTTGSFIVLALSGQLSPLRARVGGAVFAVPAGFDLRSFLRLLVLFSLTAEGVGAVALHGLVFAPAQVSDPIWQSIFHSVSAFCTAGFGLFNDSFESYRGHFWLNLIVMVLSYLGATGFIVVNDAWHALTRRARRVTLTTKIILLSTTAISLAGTVLLFFEEASLQSLEPGERALTAWFQIMSASTTVGFNSVPIGTLSASSVFLIGIVMIIGASPAGTGGGLKTTTFTALWAVMMSVIRRRTLTTFLNREIPAARIRAAVASLLLYGVTLVIGIYALALVDTASLSDQAFECASALGTVGLSKGITSALSPWGKVIVMVLMFVGRAGPIAFGMALFSPAKEGSSGTVQPEDLAM